MLSALALLKFWGEVLSDNRPLRGFRRAGIDVIRWDCVGGLYACGAGIAAGINARRVLGKARRVDQAVARLSNWFNISCSCSLGIALRRSKRAVSSVPTFRADFLSVCEYMSTATQVSPQLASKHWQYSFTYCVVTCSLEPIRPLCPHDVQLILISPLPKVIIHSVILPCFVGFYWCYWSFIQWFQSRL